LQGRQELRELQRRYSTHGTGEPVPNSLIDLKSFMRADFDCYSEIDYAYDRAENSGAFLISDNCHCLTQHQRFRLMSHMQRPLSGVKIGQL
jgi:hypothetical protein